MNSVELVVFDMAGTTVDDGDAVHTCLIAALAGAGVSVSRDEVNEVMGIPKPVAIRALLEQHTDELPGVDDVGVHRIHHDFQKRMLTFYGMDPSLREVEGASAIFQLLHSVGIKVALDTGFNRPIADTIVRRLGWDRPSLIDAIVTSDEVPRGRPHPDMILRAMELTGVTDASRVAKVGDTPSDLHEGSAAGCGLVIGVTLGSHTRAQLEYHAHTHLIGTVAEIASCLQIGDHRSKPTGVTASVAASGEEAEMEAI